MGVSSRDAVDYLSSVRRIVRLFAKTLLVLAVPLVLVAVQNMDSASAASIWFADHRIAHRLDPATIQITAAIPLPGEAEALAIDVNDASLWALAHKRLLKFDAATSLILDIDLKSLSKSLEDPKQLLLSPYDSSLWVVGEKTLLHLNPQGQALYEWRAPEKIRAVALGLDESLWLATQKELLHLSVSGSRLHQRDLKTVLKDPEFLAIDSLGGWLWLADHDQLIRINANDLTQSATVVYQTKTKNDDEDHGDDDRKISSLVLDPLTGRVWVTTKDTLLGFDRGGNLLTTVPLAPGLKETEALAYDFSSQSLWLGTKKAVTRFASDTGAVTASIPVVNELEALAVSPLRLEPTLSLIQPALNLLTNNPMPPLRLGLMAQCSGAPCNAGNGYLSSLILNVTLNGIAIGSQFAIVNSEAAYLPTNRLPEGLNAFTAQATDAFGHLSNTVTGRFTIDTIPPKFLSLTPADGSVVNTQPITIGGSLDDPAATVILENMALLGASVVDGNPQQFSFRVPLKDGPNTFVLIARDPAGNEARATLNLTYSAVSVNVTNIAPGATVNTDRLLVMGTFQGPPNTGVTVNGIVAETYGNKFYVNNLPLKSGENTITVTATTPDGLAATQSFTVTSTARAAVVVTAATQPVVVANLLTTVAGTGGGLYAGDGGLASNAQLPSPACMVRATDGSLYIVDSTYHQIRRIGPDGIITTIAGTSSKGYGGDGGPATQARLNEPSGLALGHDGSLYIADRGNHRVRRIGPDGIIATVAGNGIAGYLGDGGLATQARLNFPSGIAVGADGTLYIADTSNNRIRRVGLDGVIGTVAGTGLRGIYGDGGLATQAGLYNPFSVAVELDGTYYIGQLAFGIRRVNASGIISKLVDSSYFDIKLDPEGNLYGVKNMQAYKISPDGIATVMAGTNSQGYSGDGPATAVMLNAPRGVAPAPGGNLYIADTGNRRIRLVSPAGPSSNVALTMFTLENNTGKTLASVAVDFDGDGTVDFTTTNAATAIQHYYLKAGVYLAVFTVTDSANAVYTVTYAIVIQDAQQLDQQFKSIWDGMNGALAKSDVTTTGKYLNESAKKKYLPVMQALAPHMAQIVASFSPMARVSLSENIGEYAVTRDYNGKKRLYLVYFLRDMDGVWRLDGM